MEVARSKDESELCRAGRNTRMKGKCEELASSRRAVPVQASGKKAATSVDRDIGTV